jgi:hypothetical protein
MHTRQNSAMLAIQDTLEKLLQVLAPLAGFTSSPDSTTIKTPQLAPNDLQKRPADVGMHLLISYLQTNAHTLTGFIFTHSN